MARATDHMHSSRWQVRPMRCGSKREAEQAHDIVPAACVAWPSLTSIPESTWLFLSPGHQLLVILSLRSAHAFALERRHQALTPPEICRG